MKITEEQLLECQDQDLGYCEECDDITTEGVNPDYSEYDIYCSVCGDKSVVGIDAAVASKFVKVVEDEEETEEDY